MWQKLVLLPLLLHCSTSGPLSHDDDRRFSKEDVVAVESLRRDVRERTPLVAATEVEDLLGDGNTPREDHDAKKQMKNASGKSDEGGYYKTYGSDDEGEKGYLKATYSKGDHGYKTLDTFHKRDGDKYGFERHIAYGKARADKKSGHHDNAGSHSTKDGDHEGAGTIIDTHYVPDEGDHHDHGNEYSHYTEGGEHDRYTDDDGAHYKQNGPESSNYGHSESYSEGNGGDGSYESHSSYVSGDDGEGDDGSHY